MRTATNLIKHVYFVDFFSMTLYDQSRTPIFSGKAIQEGT